MTKRTTTKEEELTPSGILVPEGRTTRMSEDSNDTYPAMKEKALAIEELFRENAIAIQPGSHLAKLIADTKALSDGWFLNTLSAQSIPLLVNAIHIGRIAEAILPLRTDSNRMKYLDLLTSGSLDLADQERSVAKDALWEIELWAMLNRHSIAATLIDPPDIVIEYDKATIGVACKKLHTEGNVEKVLSEAVSQVEHSSAAGIVAMNLDALIPTANYLVAPSPDVVRASLSKLNTSFLARHERHFQKYLPSGRIVAVLVSTSIVVDVEDSSTGFGLGRQMDLWTIPGLPSGKKRLLRKLFGQLKG